MKVRIPNILSQNTLITLTLGGCFQFQPLDVLLLSVLSSYYVLIEAKITKENLVLPSTWVLSV